MLSIYNDFFVFKFTQNGLRVYEKQTGLKGHEQVIGGGTFGRLLKRGVAFGAMFPDYVNTMHQANEFADVEDSQLFH